ncbi:MAG TPA: transposase [Candidatus Angelobacter sp.]|jgi:hypothetical protein
MNRSKQWKAARRRRRSGDRCRQNEGRLKAMLEWLVASDGLFSNDRFHGNIKWKPAELAAQALIWAWQDSRNLTDAFAQTLETCQELGLAHGAKTYTAFINALDAYRETFRLRLGQQLQRLAQEVAGRFWQDRDFVLIGFDGSRTTAPRTVSNEREFCAANYGQGATAKYRRKQTKGMRRRQNEKHPPQPPAPQVWVTMMYHLSLRLPWSWRLGPSNSSERGHVMEMLAQEEFPENTLFCGDAGFVGYDFWNSILGSQQDFLVRVGGNVNLLSETADVKRLGQGIVLCWPQGQRDSGLPPLRLRLVKIKIGKTTMWMLTSVLDRQQLPKKKIVQYYQLRWGVEVGYRGLKQTLDKHKLRCRNSDRTYVELDWSIRAMAMAELLALREQIRRGNPGSKKTRSAYHTKDRSLAMTLRVLRKCMRSLSQRADSHHHVLHQLSRALVQRYHNRTDKRSRYRPQNSDKNPLGEPTVTLISQTQSQALSKLQEQIAA